MKKFFAAIAIALSISGGMPAVALAADPTDAAKNQICQGISGLEAGNCSRAQSRRLSGVLKNVLEILSFVAGVAAFIVIIIAGLKYITSAGDTSAITSAKHTLIYAIVGLFVVAISQFIVNFVIDAT